MDDNRFDAAARSLFASTSRRDAARTIVGLALAGSAGTLFAPIDGDAKKKKKPCDPCRIKKKGKCKGPKPDGTPCDGGSCTGGTCTPSSVSPPPPPPPPPPAGCGQYACFVRSWGSEGTVNGKFSRPSGIAVSRLTGDVYVADQNNSRVQQFSADGVFKGSWGGRGSGNSQFEFVWDVEVDSNGDVLATDYNNTEVKRFTANGQFISKFSVSENGQLLAIAIAPNRDIYVAEQTPVNKIHQFSSGGTLIRSFGGTGSGNGQINLPYGLAITATGDVLVAEAGNHRIQRFSASGIYLGQWGIQGSAIGQFDFPFGVAVAPDGTIYVADRGNNRIQHFNSSGAFLGAWGSLGSGQGQFINPEAVAVHNGQIYVADAGNNRIQQFTLDGVARERRAGASGSGASADKDRQRRRGGDRGRGRKRRGRD